MCVCLLFLTDAKLERCNIFSSFKVLPLFFFYTDNRFRIQTVVAVGRFYLKYKRDAKIIILKRSLTQTFSFHKSFRFIVQVILFVLL